KMLTVNGYERAFARAAQGVGFLQYCVEDRGEVAGRGIDDLQYLGGRGLLLQCLARLGQEPRILHRDDRPRREVLQQCDLLVGEGTNFLAAGSEVTEQGPVFAERYHEQRAGVAKIDGGPIDRLVR